MEERWRFAERVSSCSRHHEQVRSILEPGFETLSFQIVGAEGRGYDSNQTLERIGVGRCRFMMRVFQRFTSLLRPAYPPISQLRRSANDI